MLNLNIDWQEVKIRFMGKDLVAVIRPLKTKAFNLLFPSISGIEALEKSKNETKEEENERLIKSSERMADLQLLSKDILDEHLKELRGLTINNQPVTNEQLSTEMQLAPLTSAILTAMMTLTSVDEETEKNSFEPSVEE